MYVCNHVCMYYVPMYVSNHVCVHYVTVYVCISIYLPIYLATLSVCLSLSLFSFRCIVYFRVKSCLKSSRQLAYQQ